jgi:hypothetical protein
MNLKITFVGCCLHRIDEKFAYTVQGDAYADQVNVYFVQRVAYIDQVLLTLVRELLH